MVFNQIGNQNCQIGNTDIGKYRKMNEQKRKKYYSRRIIEIMKIIKKV